MAALKIKNVWLDDASCNKNGIGTYLSVDLNNGHSAVLSLDSKSTDPLFADIIAGNCNTEPMTDGDCVYWDNSASMTVDEIIAMMCAENNCKNLERAKK